MLNKNQKKHTSPPSDKKKLLRLRIHVNGIVQGVGFRPFVYNTARRLSLSGFVSNSSRGVEIEIEGIPSAITQFKEKLLHHPPPLSEITEHTITEIQTLNSSEFVIQRSLSGNANETLISPDVSICPDCLRELFDPHDRRYLYPFINCTNCGPRFTIIKGIPYDRPFTSMSKFPLCPVCKTEYENPENRRFHAQPNACPDCGPQVWFEENQNLEPVSKQDAAFDTAVKFLQQGKILAIKGLGGFHLAVDALNEEAVKRLRRRKNREEKPLALMMADLKSIQNIVYVSEREKEWLQSPQRPIVLLNKKANSSIAHTVAPGNQRLGIMLPYTPLHYILFDRLRQNNDKDELTALVLTSANRSEEPIAIDNEEARQRLSDIADGFLMHNRDILVRSDDSVLFTLNKQTQFLRRSRGFVPRPYLLKEAGASILAVGAELKNTICVLKENRAFVSQHIGDLENITANHFFKETVQTFKKILTCNPDTIVYDMHPGYFSSRWAKEQSAKKLIAVQHHHAHMASCMAENDLDEPVIGLILDGTGYGYDQTIWGGEILTGTYTAIERSASLEPMPLPGGEAAIRQPWRTAAGYLHAAFDGQPPALKTLSVYPLQFISEMIEKEVNTPFTSSCGRLFDAVAALCGIRGEAHYEAQAAIELMQMVSTLDVEPFEFEMGLPQIPLRPIIRAVTEALLQGQAQSLIAARFHRTLIELFALTLKSISKETGISKIVLSGGVFQNEILLTGLQKRLTELQLENFTQQRYPMNDGGISLGQAVIGQKLLKAGLDKAAYSVRKRVD